MLQDFKEVICISAMTMKNKLFGDWMILNFQTYNSFKEETELLSVVKPYFKKQ